MKKRQLERELGSFGWWRLRQGASHEIWTNGADSEAIPRHREIAERLARKIIESARKKPGDRTTN